MSGSEEAFLAAVFRHAAGNPANLVDMLKVGEEIGLPISETKRIVQHLIAEGLIRHEMSRHRISLTAAGCRRVERANQAEILRPTKHGDSGQGKGVFVSYSHNDTKWLKRLEVHLKPLARTGLEIWFDRQIAPGSNWYTEIQRAIDGAGFAVLLVSADFFASEFIAQDELPLLLAAAENRGMVIASLILSDSVFDRTELKRFQAFNPISKPLIEMTRSEQERTLANLATAIEKWFRR